MQTSEPVDRFLKLEAVMEITSWGKTAIYKNVKEGSFPAPVKLDARRVAWSSSSVAAWVEAKKSETRGQAA